MDDQVLKEIHRMIDQQFYVEDLNQMLKGYVQEKVLEKSIWSQLTLCTHFMLGGNSPAIYPLAAAVELIMLSLDILDDLQDRDNPAKPWMNDRPENAMNAVLGLLMGTVSHLHTKGFFASAEAAEITRSISQAVVKAIHGQHKDLNRMFHAEEDYLAMVE